MGETGVNEIKDRKKGERRQQEGEWRKVDRRVETAGERRVKKGGHESGHRM
jgi:hypothetical protein